MKSIFQCLVIMKHKGDSGVRAVYIMIYQTGRVVKREERGKKADRINHSHNKQDVLVRRNSSINTRLRFFYLYMKRKVETT